MHVTNLRKVGGSTMLAVPPALLDLLGLKPGAKVGMAIEKGRLVMEPQRRVSYTLDELLAQQPAKAPRAGKTRRSIQEREWLDSKPAGRELI